ncbi:hypothetical protein HK102_010546 [Quaeritorhiza haematococci]|nr:hypothetical protein HK102_010546 [Quaeritorhiza haematococci]
MKAATVIVGLLSVALSTFASPIDLVEVEERQNAPDPSKTFIQSISYGGSGCPQGSVGINFNPTRNAFTLLFDQFVASVGPDVAFTERIKNCQLNIDLRLPAGWQYAVGTVDYRGFMELDSRVKANLSSKYYFQGDLRGSTVTETFVGPLTKNYVERGQFDYNTWVWSPCGGSRNININTQILVSNDENRSGRGQMTTDSIDGKIEQKYGLTYRLC